MTHSKYSPWYIPLACSNGAGYEYAEVCSLAIHAHSINDANMIACNVYMCSTYNQLEGVAGPAQTVYL